MTFLKLCVWARRISGRVLFKLGNRAFIFRARDFKSCVWARCLKSCVQACIFKPCVWARDFKSCVQARRFKLCIWACVFKSCIWACRFKSCVWARHFKSCVWAHHFKSFKWQAHCVFWRILFQVTFLGLSSSSSSHSCSRVLLKYLVPQVVWFEPVDIVGD
jgi:hypothetical protein